MSKIPPNSYFVPRSLKQHPLWLSATVEWRAVLDWMLDHAAYKDGYPFDNNGSVEYLKKGQVGFSYRQIAEDCKITKNHVEGALKHFQGLTAKKKIHVQVASGECRALVRQEVRQGIRQEKCIYSILWEGYFETYQTSSQTANQTGGQTRVRQESDTKKKDKKEKKVAKEDFVLDKSKTQSSTPYPLKGEAAASPLGGGIKNTKGKRKQRYRYPGKISHEALDFQAKSLEVGIPVSADIFQKYIDLKGIKAVKAEYNSMAIAHRAGNKLKCPPHFALTARLQEHRDIIENDKIINIQEA